MTRWRLFGATALALGTVGVAAHAETLTEAMSEAYETNPQLLAERALLRETDEGVPQALAGWRPTVQATASAGYEKLDSTQISNLPRRPTLHPRTTDLNVTQPIFEGGRTVALTAEAKDSVRAERSRAVATESQVLFSVAEAYFDVLRDAATVDINRNNEKVLRTELEATQDQFSAGAVTRTDVAQAQARLSAATASRQQAEGTYASGRAAYTQIVGHAPENLKQPSLAPQLPATREELVDRAATENPSVIASVFSESAARHEVKATAAQLLPKISIIGTYDKSLDGSQYVGYRSTSETVITQMTVPLYEAGTIYSQVREANEKVSQVKSQTDQAQRVAVQQATQEWETIIATQSSITSLQAGIRADKVALDGIREEQKVGTRTVLDVLNTEQDLFSIEVNLIVAQHDLAVAQFSLAQQIGTLTAEELSLPVKLYNVYRHYDSVKGKWIGFGAKD